MTYESNSGLGVKNHYGPRGVQAGVASGGEVHGSGVVREAVVYITGEDFVSGSFDTELIIPKGAKFIEAYTEVTEAFVLGGTTPTINVGTKGTEGTNYAVELSKAQAEAVGEVYSGTGAGTYAAPLAAASAVSVALDGTTPTVTGAGKAKVVIRYIKI